MARFYSRANDCRSDYRDSVLCTGQQFRRKSSPSLRGTLTTESQHSELRLEETSLGFSMPVFTKSALERSPSDGRSAYSDGARTSSAVLESGFVEGGNRQAVGPSSNDDRP